VFNFYGYSCYHNDGSNCDATYSMSNMLHIVQVIYTACIRTKLGGH